jgi:type II secretion system protein G
MIKNNNKGFTLIELLVVIAIIGLLATLTVASLNSARSKSRDARRLSDIKQIQTALELYLNDQGSYPTAIAVAHVGDCMDSGGIKASGCSEPIYLRSFPGDPSTNNPYLYALGATSDTYTLQYELENPMAGLCGATGIAGTHIATPAGICDDDT